MVVGAKENGLADAVIITIARLNNDPNYKTQGNVVRHSLWTGSYTRHVSILRTVRGFLYLPDFTNTFVNIRSWYIQD